MHTVTMIAGGLVLLVVMLLVGRRMGGNARAAMAGWFFIPVWLVVALVNMWVGVSRAGYSVAEEFPILLVVFGVPAGIAALAAGRLGRR